MSDREDSDAGTAVLSEADEDYLRLVHRCPLRPIRSGAELDRAIATLNWLIDKGVAGLRTLSEGDYMDVLSDLIEAHEEIHHPMRSERGDGKRLE